MANTCCPIGYVYIDGSGNFNDPAIGMGTISNPTPSSFYNTCVTLVNGTWALAPPVDPIACLCCNLGYTYSSLRGLCFSPTSSVVYSPIPCIICVCDVMPPPPCDTCTSPAIAIAIHLDETIKGCIDCTVDESPLPSPNKNLNNFTADRLVDPTIIFKLL